MSIVLLLQMEKGEYYDFNHSSGSVYPTLYIIRLLGQVYHFSLMVCYSCSLQFIDSRRFMASSFSNLVSNLSEGICRIECKYGHDHKKCETCGIKCKYYNCYLDLMNLKMI